MKTLSANLKSHLAQEVTTLCTCWKASLTNGVVYGFTDNTKDLLIDGIKYKASTGYTPTSISTSSQFNVDNLDVQALLSDDSITNRDLLSGLWDYAKIEIFELNYNAISDGVNQLRVGWLGEITIKDNSFTTELRGMMQKYQQSIGRVYAPACDATLGDTRCGKNLIALTFTGTIESVISQRQFLASSLLQAIGYFDYGLIKWNSGLNAGLSMEVKTYVTGNVLLQLPMANTIVVGDSFTIVAGCNKTLFHCKDKFNNVINFRGFPHVSGTDKVLKGPNR